MKQFLRCKDHAVSGETFDLILDVQKEMLITSPQPEENRVPKYYHSEDYISHTDARRNWLERVYAFVKKRAINNKLGQIQKWCPVGGKLLDVGAGTGTFMLEARKRGWSVTGVEPSVRAAQIAKEKGLNLEKSIFDIAEQQFDVITLWHVLEHMPNLDQQVQQLLKLLKPTGIIFIAVPNFKSYDANYYGTYWAAYDVPRHLWHFSPKSIERIFKEHKSYVVKILPMIFDSFYISFLSEKYMNSSFAAFRAFYRGLCSNMKAMRTGNYSSLTYVVKKN